MCDDDDRIPEDPDEIEKCNRADDWVTEQYEIGFLAHAPGPPASGASMIQGPADW